MSFIQIIPGFINQEEPPVVPVSLIKTEPLTVIKNEPPESELKEICIDDVFDSSDKEIISDIKNIDIVSHTLYEGSLKRETVPKIILEMKHSESVETQFFVKTENVPFVKIENITESENLIKTEDIGDGNVSRCTGQGVVEVPVSNEDFNALGNLESDEQLVLNFPKDLNDINIRSGKVEHPEKTDFAECYKTVKTTSWEKDKEVIEAPVILYCCEKCTFVSGKYSKFKQHELFHKTKAKTDLQRLTYHCDKCYYKTFIRRNLMKHKIIHLKPGETQYFYCYHCSYKSNRKENLKTHISKHFRNEDVLFHCYICDFMTPKRDLLIEHFKKHSKHHSKCDETKYNYQLETRTEKREIRYHCDNCDYKTYKHNHFKMHKLIHLKPKEIQYFYCYHCSYKAKRKDQVKTHIFRHFKNGDVPFHCYICDFMTRKRDLIIEHFKKHSKHHSKCDETKYNSQLVTRTRKREKRYCCEKCAFVSGKYSYFKLHELSHKTKAEMDDRDLKYRCEKCDYKTYRHQNLKRHKLNHLKPEEIQYLYCYHCSYKSKRKPNLKMHIFRHFKNEDVPFHCYICDFITPKRDLLIEHFKKHSNHHSK